MAAVICAKAGCNLPVYVEPRTQIVHQYCGRTHAQEALGNTNVQQPHGTCNRCNFRGCTKQVAFDDSRGRVHDFCCKEHADRAIASGEWVKPQRYTYHGGGEKKKASGPLCRFPNCQIPVFTDPTTGRKLDYCGRSHAVEHRLMQARVGHSSAPAFAAATSPVVHSVNGSSLTTVISGATNTDRIRRSGVVRAIPVSATVPTVPEEIVDERKPAAVPLPKCAICLAMNASIILIPCGHVCLCKDDAERLRRNQQLLNCPICRREVISTNEVFLNH